jgi:DNA topoisomerase IA
MYKGGDTFLRCVANFSTTVLPPLLTLSTTLCAKSLLRQCPFSSENSSLLNHHLAIKGLLQKSNHVVIATDGDREGEVIGRELLDYFEWTGNINRLWLTALDDNSIKKALNSLKQGSETEPL